MTPELRDEIQRVLWPAGTKSPLTVWAVLDGARDPAINLALIESRLEFRCLYSGRLPRELERVAPQLVELLPGHRLTERLLGDAWGRSWGIFLRITDPSNLRHHLRKFLRVREEGGRNLLLRYYDPRVLGPFLRSCDSAQLVAFFGPIASFGAEDGNGFSEFGLERGRLVEKRHPVSY